MRHELKKRLLVSCASLSLILHGILFFLSPISSDISERISNLKDRAVEIVSSEELEKVRKPVVQTTKAESLKDSKVQADYAGEFEQRVEQQTQSPLQGAFQEGQLGRLKESPEVLEKGNEEGQNSKTFALKDFLTFGRSPHALSKEIPLGNQTILNTDKVRYASFVNRIADEIYYPWVEAAERVVRDFAAGHRKIEANLYITRLKITLDEEGAVKGVQVLSSCGIAELDEAPKKAFWEVEPFPHPPYQLMENDGYVRLTYEFQFEWKNSLFNIIPWKI